MKLKLILLLFTFINITICSGEESFNISSLDSLNSNNLPYDKKIIINTIKKWQNYSYKNDKLNCQYHPSCSNFFAQSIINNNTYFGIIKGTDRIIRCNVYAIDYHKNTYKAEYLYDGRIIDYINPTINPTSPKNSLVSTLLSVIPGAGRAYSGRPIDGLISFSTIVLLSQTSYIQHNKGNHYISIPSGMITLTLWLSDFYGAYRSSRVAK